MSLQSVNANVFGERKLELTYLSLQKNARESFLICYNKLFYFCFVFAFLFFFCCCCCCCCFWLKIVMEIKFAFKMCPFLLKFLKSWPFLKYCKQGSSVHQKGLGEEEAFLTWSGDSLAQLGDIAKLKSRTFSARGGSGV